MEGNKIEKIEFGKKVRFYFEDFYDYPALLSAFIYENKELRVPLVEGKISKLIPTYYDKGEKYFEVQIKDLKDYPQLTKLNKLALRCEVKDGGGWVKKSKLALAKLTDCDEQNQLTKENYKDKNAEKLIQEINIRLAGFGGNVPTDNFDDRTEAAIKQFQRDYMQVPQTGKICAGVLKAIDEFSRKFDIKTMLWDQLKCSCSTKGKQVKSELREILETNNCNGFGDHTGKGTYREGKEKLELYHKYEYPGIHRSLLFGVKALLFYFSKQTIYTLDSISSGYRCRFKNYKSTNHQGKAVDIQFNKGSWEIRDRVFKNIIELEKIRDDFFIKYLKAKTNWSEKNNYGLEPIGLNENNTKIDDNHTYSWIHMDVRTFESKYLEDKYFAKTRTELNGKTLVDLAKELDLYEPCNCSK